jgi:F-type H+-transporting ATPase subunit b
MNAAPSQAVQMAHTASVEQVAVEHEANVLGVTAPGIVALSMIVVLVVIWVKGGFKSLGSGLDNKIATIRRQLDEAAALRAEAETLRTEAQTKASAAHKDAEAILAHAKVEAEQLVAQAKIDADELIVRRSKMAQDKIASAERAAIAEVRAMAAAAAASAASSLIAQRHDAVADKALIDRTITGLN